MRIIFRLPLLLLVCLLFARVETVSAQVRTVGKIYYDDTTATLGYTLFTPNQSFKTYLIENCGLRVHDWYSTYQPGMMAYLREDGLLLRTGRDFSNGAFASNGGNGGVLELLDWWSQRLWFYKVSDAKVQAHHDVGLMPNGNILVLAWEKFDQTACSLAGRDPSQLVDGEVWAEAIFELQPIFPDSAVIVWEWHIWDHMVQDFDPSAANFGVVSDHPELMDANYLGISAGHADWLHANSVAYNPIRDEVVVSFRETSEIMVIDHSTTTGEAAGHAGGYHGKGGDIVYRWGNPVAYGRGQSGDQQLWQQHDAHWVDAGLPHAGELIIFNNGFAKPGGVSSVEFVQPDLDSLGHYNIGSGAFLPDSAQYSFYTLPGDTINSVIMAGAQMLPNGNLLVSQAVHGRFVEFDANRRRVWEYVNPALPLSLFVSQGNAVPVNGIAWANAVFKARKYLPDFPGFDAKPLPHLNPLENAPYPDSTCSTPVGFALAMERNFDVFPNPVADVLHLRSSVAQKADWYMVDVLGKVVKNGVLRGLEADVEVGDLPTGIYVLRIGRAYHRKIVVE